MTNAPAPLFAAGDYFFKPLAYGFIFLGILRTVLDEPGHGMVLVLVGLIVIAFVRRAEEYR